MGGTDSFANHRSIVLKAHFCVSLLSSQGAGNTLLLKGKLFVSARVKFNLLSRLTAVNCLFLLVVQGHMPTVEDVNGGAFPSFGQKCKAENL